jgi:hypothetical protein
VGEARLWPTTTVHGSGFTTLDVAAPADGASRAGGSVRFGSRRPMRAGHRPAESGSRAYDLVEAFSWTDEDQNVVAACIAQDKTTPEDAAARWVEDNPERVEA